MKIKLSWIITAVVLVSIASLLVPRLRYFFPSSAVSAWEPARVEQATPESTVNLMFQMTDQGGEADNPKDVMTDRLNNMHMLQGKGAMTPEEQKFAALFLNKERSAAIYGALRANLAKSAQITANNTTGETSVIAVTVDIFPDHSSDWVPTPCTVELKKRGDNWYIDDVKSPRVPEGIYQKFKQKMGYAQ
jgi:hypothetical protein